MAVVAVGRQHATAWRACDASLSRDGRSVPGLPWGGRCPTGPGRLRGVLPWDGRSGWGQLHEDQGVSWRHDASGQRFVGRWVVDRERRAEERGGGSDRGSVGARVGNDQEQPVEPAIRGFATQTPELLLDVDESRFEFDATRVPCAIRERQIPRPQVPPVADRHLSADHDIRAEERPERLRQSQVGHVTKWLSGGVQAKRDVHPDDGCDPVQHAEVDPRSEASFDPTQLRRRHADHLRNVLERQGRGLTRGAQLRPKSIEEPSRPAVRAGDA